MDDKSPRTLLIGRVNQHIQTQAPSTRRDSALVHWYTPHFTPRLPRMILIAIGTGLLRVDRISHCRALSGSAGWTRTSYAEVGSVLVIGCIPRCFSMSQNIKHLLLKKMMALLNRGGPF